MSAWKLVLLRTFGFGAGFAILLSAVGGALVWYKGRPKPPKPWNKQAITAEYINVLPEGDKNDVSFHYVVQNNTDSDYRLDSDFGIETTGRLRQENGFAPFSSHFVTAQYPLFVPAKSRVRMALSIPYPYPERAKDKPTPDERKQYAATVAKYVTDEMGNLDGFALFDTINRYEIDFPSGWQQKKSESR